MRVYLLAAIATLAAPFVHSEPFPNGALRTSPKVTARAGTAQKLAPKVMIISMYDDEVEIWTGIPEFDILAQNITVTGLSAEFPAVHCTSDGSVCQVATAEGEINAAVTITSLFLSPLFDLKSTYFLVAGVGGINPEVASLASVTFARYAVQVALQYEIDPRELPANFSTGYVPQGSFAPDQYPGFLYGTEVFELNDALRKLAVGFARTAVLNDSAEAVAYRALYATPEGIYSAGTQPPSVVECDVATSDNWFSGRLLGEAFSNYTKMITNGTGLYCNTAQEDNATLEALLRGHIAGLVDFSRIIIMRTASDMDRPYPGEAATTNIWYANSGGYPPALKNLYLAGIRIIEGILDGWNETFANGVNATNYVGDILGSIGGIPDFGPGPVSQVQSTKKKRAAKRQAKSYLKI